MSNVYFIPLKEYNEEKISEYAKIILAELVENEGVELEKTIPLKVHFGEHGNDTFIKPKCYEGIVDYLKEKNIDSSYIETNVLYRGRRTTRESHIAVAKEHGFTNLPIIIADGDHGEDSIEIPINGKIFKTVKLGKAFNDYKQIIVLAHFKGHEQAGFGGAMKQLAMGFASRGGKLSQHATINPTVTQDECVSCKSCLDSCNWNAITVDDKAYIDQEKCVGCAACIAQCPVGAIKNDWGAKDFKKRVAEYAYGANLNKKNIYINFVYNITELCDCAGKHMECIAQNIGIFASLDPVSIDCACLDMLQKNENKKIFEEGRETLDYTEEISFGEKDYTLIELNLS